MNSFLIGEGCLCIHFKRLQYHKSLVFLQTRLTSGSCLAVQLLCSIKEREGFPVSMNCCVHVLAISLTPIPIFLLFVGVRHAPCLCIQAHLAWNGRGCWKFHYISIITRQGRGGLWKAVTWHCRLQRPWSYPDLCQRLNQEPLPALIMRKVQGWWTDTCVCVCSFLVTMMKVLFAVPKNICHSFLYSRCVIYVLTYNNESKKESLTFYLLEVSEEK